jgi:CheY-like chemotaxis protein
MPKEIYICWIDDTPQAIASLDPHIRILQDEHKISFIIDEHLSTREFDTIARNVDNDLFFFVDFNLKSSTNENIDGNEVIALIRQNNKKCPIVFYSSNATEEELRKLVKGHEKIKVVLREDLPWILTSIADGTFTC